MDFKEELHTSGIFVCFVVFFPERLASDVNVPELVFAPIFFAHVV